MKSEAERQFEAVIKSDLRRWWEESDLEAEDLAKAALRAIDSWLDEDCIEFELE